MCADTADDVVVFFFSFFSFVVATGNVFFLFDLGCVEVTAFDFELVLFDFKCAVEV